MFQIYLFLRSEKEAYEPAAQESVAVQVIQLPAEVDKTFRRLQRYAVLPSPHKHKKGKEFTLICALKISEIKAMVII